LKKYNLEYFFLAKTGTAVVRVPVVQLCGGWDVMLLTLIHIQFSPLGGGSLPELPFACSPVGLGVNIMT